jgi:uncharacterized protein (TIGR02246 family)
VPAPPSLIRLFLATALSITASASLLAQSQPAEGEKAIRANSQAYIKAFNAADIDTLASLWAEDAISTNRETGETIEGRDNIKAAAQATFKGDTKPRLEANIHSIRFLSEDVAVEEGAATLILPGTPPQHSTYSAILVLRDGQWLIHRVFETERPAPSAHHEHLQALAWLVGEWIDESETSSVHYTCDWVANRNFLKREFSVLTPEGAPFEGTEIIGWDPLKNHIRSWLFDSAGGFAEREWKFRSGENEDDRWLIHGNGVLQGGQKASAVHIITPVDNNHYTFEAVARELGGELLPNIDETLIRRVPSP